MLLLIGNEHRKVLADNQIMAHAVSCFRPDLYQILCYDCNCGRSANKGICPHKDKTKEEYLAWTDTLLESRLVNQNPRIRLTKEQQLQELLKKMSPEDVAHVFKLKGP